MAAEFTRAPLSHQEGAMVLDRPKSVTHQHILSVINSEANRFPTGATLRILDAGCGNGELIAYLHKCLPILKPALSFEVFGFDVGDFGGQRQGIVKKAINDLVNRFPGVDWSSRVIEFNVNDPWPYPDGFFDVICSNQVLEHVQDHNLFFHEISYKLTPHGYSVHLFPLINNIFEGHTRIPWVHRFKNYDFMANYINCISRLGIGGYNRNNKMYGLSRDAYSKRMADFICYFTNYLRYGDVLQLGKTYGLRTSFRYTLQFYMTKMRHVLSSTPRYEYAKGRSVLVDFLAILVFKYVASVTLFLEKEQTYHTTYDELPRAPR